MLFPDVYIESTYHIDFEKLYSMGYRGVIFDIDNTLVGHGKPQDARSMALFKRLKNIGFKYCLLSNNKRPRVESFAEPVGAKFIYKAAKPKKEGYLKAVEELELKKDEVFFVGDQIFTDVAGATNAGLFTILVKQLYRQEEIQIVLKRILEKPIIALYLIRKKLLHKTDTL